MGGAASVLWTAQGKYLSKCSDSTTISRNAGIFWALFQMSLLFGNGFVYYQFQGQTKISADTRHFVFWVLTVISIVGVLLLCVLKDPMGYSPRINVQEKSSTFNWHSIVKEFLTSVRLFMTKEMLMLSSTFLYTGKN